MNVQEAITVMGMNDTTEKNIDLTFIKKQYRKMALECHPDKCGGDSTKFHKLTEAYALLCSTPNIVRTVNRDRTIDYDIDLKEIPDNIIELFNSVNVPEVKYRLAVDINELHLKERSVLYKCGDSNETLIVSLMQKQTVFNGNLRFTIVKGDTSLPTNTVLEQCNDTVLYKYTVTLKSIEELKLFNRTVPFPNGSMKRITINDLFGKLLKCGTDTLYIGESGVPFWYIDNETKDTRTVPFYIQFTC